MTRVPACVRSQRALLKSHGLLSPEGIPTFPLYVCARVLMVSSLTCSTSNTDGIDPSGQNVLIEDVYIEVGRAPSASLTPLD
jgi:hypothetical protein